jgi:hypothetical protein
MDEKMRPRTETVTNLRDAIRRARLDDAERSGAIADLRAAETARLEILRDALAPIFADLPEETELFDHGLVPGERPRLFIDILAFVEMGRDKRHYRFVQDSRWGQRLILESDDIQAVIRSVTDYVALRLVERQKALASDQLGTRGRPVETPRAEVPKLESAKPPPAGASTTLREAARTVQREADPPPPIANPQPTGTNRSPIVVFVLGVAAGILAMLFLGLMRARGFLL